MSIAEEELCTEELLTVLTLDDEESDSLDSISTATGELIRESTGKTMINTCRKIPRSKPTINGRQCKEDILNSWGRHENRSSRCMQPNKQKRITNVRCRESTWPGVNNASARENHSQIKKRRPTSSTSSGTNSTMTSTARLVDEMSGSSSTAIEKHNPSITPSNQHEGLSPWERWFLAKEKQRRNDERKRKTEHQAEIQRQAERAKSKVERQTKANQKHKEWLAAKMNILNNLKAQQELERKKEEEKKLALDLKKAESERRFEQWIERKKKEIVQKENAERNMVKLRTSQAAQQRKAANAAYARWVRSSRNRAVRDSMSFGYVNGKLIAYYDRASNPKPSFNNPNPWIDPLEG